LGWQIRRRDPAFDGVAVTFRALGLAGVVLIEPEFHRDHRGFFARLLASDELQANGLATNYCQEAIAHNAARGTIRGLHYQVPPYAETKIVRCVRGAAYDVVVDIRAASASFGRWISVELDAEMRQGLYIPTGFAHGYQTLEPGTELHYKIVPGYEPSAARGVHYADPTLAIPWPISPAIISDRDLNHPPLYQ